MTLLNQSSLSEFCSQYLIQLDMKRCFCHVALKWVRQINPYPVFSPFEIHFNSLVNTDCWRKIISVFISIHIIQRYPEIAFSFSNWFLHSADFYTNKKWENTVEIRLPLLFFIKMRIQFTDLFSKAIGLILYCDNHFRWTHFFLSNAAHCCTDGCVFVSYVRFSSKFGLRFNPLIDLH